MYCVLLYSFIYTCIVKQLLHVCTELKLGYSLLTAVLLLLLLLLLLRCVWCGGRGGTDPGQGRTTGAIGAIGAGHCRHSAVMRTQDTHPPITLWIMTTLLLNTCEVGIGTFRFCKYYKTTYFQWYPIPWCSSLVSMEIFAGTCIDVEVYWWWCWWWWFCGQGGFMVYLCGYFAPPPTTHHHHKIKGNGRIE